MAEEKVRSLNIRPIGDAISGHVSFGLAAQPILHNNGALSTNQQVVAQKTRDHLTEQAGTAIVGVHASHLTTQVEQYALERIDESMAFDRQLRQKHRNKEDQVHMEQVCHHFRELTISGQAAIYNATVDRLVEISRRPLEPEKEETETVIVEQDPGFFGRLFGSTRTMTVKR